MREVVLGYDVGGTKILAVVGDTNGVVYSKIEKKTIKHLGRERLMQQLYEIGEEALKTANKKITKIGVIFAGLIDQNTGTVITSPNIPSADGLRICELLTGHFRVPSYIENDATAAAIAEKMFGVAKNAEDFIYIPLSTGIGSGIFVNGKVLRGAHGLAGELGHTVIQIHGPQCSCGREGCFEALASGSAIARYATENIEELIKDGARIQEKERVDARAVFNLFMQGNRTAAEIVNHVVEIIAIGIVNIACILDPEMVILGGGLSRAGDDFIESIRKAVKKEFKTMKRDLRIVRATTDITELSPLALIGYQASLE